MTLLHFRRSRLSINFRRSAVSHVNQHTKVIHTVTAMQHRHLFETRKEMTNCIVLERFGQCSTFELYRESDNSFIMACVVDHKTNGLLLFTTFRDSHLRAFNDILALMKDHEDYVGKLSRDWISGLNFALLNRSKEVVCDIKFLSSIFERLPISFKMKIYPSAEDDERLSLPPPSQPRASLAFRLSCFSDTGCLEASEEPSRGSSGTYTTLEESLDSDTVYLQTRKPVWNRESSAAEHYNATQFLGHTATAQSGGMLGSVVTSAVEAQSTDRVCIRHGQRTSNTYILDYRAPASALVAFAAMCATHAAKPLVNA